MGKSSCCSKEGLNRGAWTAEEDKILRDYITVHGEGKWRRLPERAGLKRCGKSCRLRWLNYLRPDIKRGNISQDEEDLIIRLHKLLGNRWSLIAGRLPGRTDNEIKNYWNTNLGKKVRDRHTTGTEKNIQKTKPQSTLEATPSPSSLSPSKQEPHSRVFLTEASKCSKLLFVNPPPQSSMPSSQNKSNNEPELEADHAEEPLLLADDGAANVSGGNKILENSVYDNDLLSFPREDQRELPTDLVFDFGLGEVCLSDLLNSDFSSGMCNLGYNNYSGGEELLPFWDKPLLSSHEILNDYRTQSNFDEMNGANSYFHSFTPSQGE